MFCMDPLVAKDAHIMLFFVVVFFLFFRGGGVLDKCNFKQFSLNFVLQKSLSEARVIKR